MNKGLVGLKRKVEYICQPVVVLLHPVQTETASSGRCLALPITVIDRAVYFWPRTWPATNSVVNQAVATKKAGTIKPLKIWDSILVSNRAYWLTKV